jgi:hypothetical protein
MPTAVRDASMVTKKNRDIALNAYYNSWKESTVNGTGNAVNAALAPPAATGAEVVAQIREGCSACAALTNFNEIALGGTQGNLTRYPPNPTTGGASGLTGTS